VKPARRRYYGWYVNADGWSRADLSLGPMLFYVWAGVIVGRLIDRRCWPRSAVQGAAALPLEDHLPGGRTLPSAG